MGAGNTVTIEKPSTQTPRQVMALHGEGTPGSTITVEGVVNERGQKPRADVAPDGKWGAHAIAPERPGVHEISVESQGETAKTTFAVADPAQARRR